jgi:hypothetical protein
MTKQELDQLKRAAQEANSRYALACREYKRQQRTGSAK